MRDDLGTTIEEGVARGYLRDTRKGSRTVGTGEGFRGTDINDPPDKLPTGAWIGPRYPIGSFDRTAAASFGRASALPGAGRSAGRGSRGYQRSAARIEEDANEDLTAHPDLDATEVEFRVEQGEVTLTGMVDTRADRRLAEDIVAGVPGVRDVHNRLRVRNR